MVDIVNWVPVRSASISDAVVRHTPTDASSGRGALPSLATVSPDQWHALADRAIEPNAYYLPDWELAVNASARERTNASALCAWSGGFSDEPGAGRLIGLMPMTSSWHAYKIPLPVLVSADPYGTLCTPLLDRDMAPEAVTELMRQARDAGARALILRNVALDGAAMKTFTHVLERAGITPHMLQQHARACLDATRDAEELLRESLGVKKLKELRRQRNRLSEHGDVIFEVARSPDDVARALDIFLALEASGWKARRGTALAQDAGDTTFVHRATLALAEKGQCEIVTLRAGDSPVAAAIVLRHRDRAFYFKLGIDERFAKLSPGVQLTLDLTRHLCADPAIALVDSTASPGHPMIDPIWRGRLAIGDVLIPLRRNDPIMPLFRAAMILRKLVREPARRAVHFIRKRQEKHT